MWTDVVRGVFRGRQPRADDCLHVTTGKQAGATVPKVQSIPGSDPADGYHLSVNVCM